MIKSLFSLPLFFAATIVATVGLLSTACTPPEPDVPSAAFTASP